MFRNYIGGTWVEGDRTVSNINPSDTRDIIGEYALANEGQVDQAIEAAAESAPVWGAATAEQRSDALDRIGTAILSRQEELGTLLSREEGKPLVEGIGEVIRAGRVFKFFAGESLRMSGEHLPSIRSGVEVDVARHPVGSVGVITPWNFPIAIPAWKIAPALAYGNSVVFKPAGLATASAWALTEIIAETAGLPAGVFNLAMGSGRVVGDRLARSPQIDAITFTGSTPVGRGLAVLCAERGAKVQLEMGGKNPLIIREDADLDLAVQLAVSGGLYSTGQRCTASSRIIVEAGIYEQYVDKISKVVRNLRVGHALNEGTDIGPVVSEDQLAADLNYIAQASAEGGELQCGGELLERETPGHYLSPAVFSGTTNEMTVNREEVFGPIIGIIRADDYEHALNIANDTSFGLSSGICTRSLAHAADFKRRSKAGMIMVNLPTAGVDYHAPFGGIGASSYGPREQGSHARQFFTTTRTRYTASGDI